MGREEDIHLDHHKDSMGMGNLLAILRDRVAVNKDNTHPVHHMDHLEMVMGINPLMALPAATHPLDPTPQIHPEVPTLIPPHRTLPAVPARINVEDGDVDIRD